MTKDTIIDFIDTLGYVPVLGAGEHADPEDGACVMEMVSFIYEEWTDTPSCTMKFIATTAQTVNDRLSDSARHLILSQFDRLFGTSALDHSKELSAAFFAELLIVARKWYSIVSEQGYNSTYSRIFNSANKEVYTYLQKTPEYLEDINRLWEEERADFVFEQILRQYEISDEQKVNILSDILDIADNILGRDEITPVDKSRLIMLESVRPSVFNQVRYEPS